MPAKANLHHSQKFYFIKLDRQGYFLQANNCFKNRFSFLNLQFAGLPGTVTLHPADYEVFQKAFAGTIRQKEGIIHVLLRMMKEGGGYFFMDWELSPCTDDETGQITGVCGVGVEAQDVTLNALKAEMNVQLLKLLSDSSSDGILLLDSNYCILAYNKPAEDFSLEMYKRRYIAGDDFRKYIRPEAEHLFYRQFNSALVGTETEQVFEMLDKGGQKVYLKVQMTPVHDNNDETVSGVAVITKDVTAENDLHNRLNHVTALQSHQVRRPVANMLSLLNLLDDSKFDDREREYLLLLKNSVEELDAEIRQIVHAARKMVK